MKRVLAMIVLMCTVLLFSECKKDICDDIVCLNGGECLNGLCSCPDGFSGPACEQQKTPSKIIIKQHSVTVKDYPTETVSGGFDNDSDPDIYFVLKEKNNEEIFNAYWTYYENCDGQDLTFWHPEIEIDVTDDQREFHLYLYDEDENEDGTDDLVDIVFVELDFEEFGFFEMYDNNTGLGTQVSFKLEYKFD